MRIVGAVSRTQVDRTLSEVVGISNLGVVISGSLKEALSTKTDVLIDFTSPDVVKENVMLALDRKVNVVIGTSGLTDSNYRAIDRKARRMKAGVIAGGNFAISAVLLEHFATVAAKYMPSWELIEYAADLKPDAPSGTARQLAYALSTVRHPKQAVAVSKTKGQKESRGYTLHGTQVHSVRLPGYVGGIEVIFGKTGERLSIRHDAGDDPGPYLNGVLLAARRVRTVTGLRRGLWDVIT